MRQIIKSFLWVGLLVLGLQRSWGYALLGPMTGNGSEPWQVIQIGYQLPYLEVYTDGGQVFLGDIGGPKNWGEEYRRNAPTLYYTVDELFYDYFQDSGVNAIQQAFGIMNSLTNVDSYSTYLSEFPMTSQEINYTAQTLGLTDLKSVTLHLLLEQLGLAQPERFAWTLHERNVLAGAPAPCPLYMQYLVVMRNFDPVPSALTQAPWGQFTPYINGILYTYAIDEVCTPTALNPAAITVPLTVDYDPSVNTFSAVAANNVDGLALGGFYTGLTRDDVAGLRYLLSTNNLNWETTAAGSILTSSSSGTTNFGLPYTLYTSNYTAFAMNALTNDPTTLSNLFPGLIIMSSSNYPVVVHTPNIVAYFTNSFVLGNPPVLVIKTNGYTDSVVLHYVDSFANLFVTNSFLAKYYHTNTSAKLVTVQVTQSGVLGNGLVTNTSIKTIILTNVPSGDYYITTNLCGLNILYQLTNYANVVATTNILVTASNSAGLFYSQSVVVYTTNHAYWVEPLICAGGGISGVSNVSGLYAGLGKVNFVYAPYDSLLSQYFQPITNTYSIVMVTNSQLNLQSFERVVTGPDILFSAGDLASGPAANGFNGTVQRSNLNTVEDPQQVGSTVAFGPGVINSPSVFTFNKVGPSFYNVSQPNSTALIPNEASGVQGLIWASFDGTTNDPIVYPNGSYTNLLAAVLIQISPANGSLPNGTNNVAYGPILFTATGGAFSPPYSWSASGLPAGLTMTNSATVVSGGILSGTPTQSGTNTFTVQITDAATRTMQWTYSIFIK